MSRRIEVSYALNSYSCVMYLPCVEGGVRMVHNLGPRIIILKEKIGKDHTGTLDIVEELFSLVIPTSFLSFAPQPSLGLGLLHKIWLNFLEASQQFSFLQGRVVTTTPILEDQASVFISPRGMVGTHFSHLL
jgi:hypothetical protein